MKDGAEIIGLLDGRYEIPEQIASENRIQKYEKKTASAKKTRVKKTVQKDDEKPKEQAKDQPEEKPKTVIDNKIPPFASNKDRSDFAKTLGNAKTVIGFEGTEEEFIDQIAATIQEGKIRRRGYASVFLAHFGDENGKALYEELKKKLDKLKSLVQA